MRIAITGSGGQLGAALASALSSLFDLIPLRRATLDITDLDESKKVLSKVSPDVVIHCAAMTDVDGCARQPDLAYFVNSIGTKNIALACAEIESVMVYISTNEVFSGKTTEPYFEWSNPDPINPYGYSKAAGERFVCHLLNRFYIVRTAWLYSWSGQNFPHRILQMAREGKTLSVVTDEIGNPTYIPDLVSAISRLIRTETYGIYHITNSNYCSRHEFAREILDLIGQAHVPIKPITQAEYERFSTPPRFAPLGNMTAAALGIELRSWQEALKEFISCETT